MNRIICPNCGQVPVYTLMHIERTILLFTAEGKQGGTERGRSNTTEIKRCLKCKAEVTIEKDGKLIQLDKQNENSSGE